MHNSQYIKGFSLVELAIVITIIGVTIGSGLTVLSEYSKVSKIKQTKTRIQEIMEAIDDYADEYGYLPCPADSTATFGSAALGVGTFTTACDTETLNGGGASPLLMGAVPTANLNLYPSMALDGWGRRLTYIIRENIADTASGEGLDASDIDIDLRDYTGSSTYSNIAVIVMSHGANGYGAYLGRGGSSRIDPTGGITQEDNNNDETTYFHSSVSVAGFDDILYYWTLSQITDPNME